MEALNLLQYYLIPMNLYSKHTIKKFYEMYLSKTFDQDDVAFFIAINRDYTPKGSIFRELGDFLAHPNLKDRGMVIKTLKPAVDYFEKNTDAMMGGQRPTIDIPFGVGAKHEILEDLFIVFNVVGKKMSNNEVQSQRFREFMFCLIFLLSNFRIELNNKICSLEVHFSGSLSLTVKYPSDKYPNYSIILKLAFLDNVHTKCLAYSPFGLEIKSHIVRRIFNGSLAAVPYDFDNNEYLSGAKKFPRGVGLPLEEV